jgi:eukaryotic-like serine/threonine-protein kinase
MRLGNGQLILDAVKAAPANCLSVRGHKAAFDVIAFSGIAARQPRDRYGYEGRAHSLWFCDAYDEGIYRWYELAFMVHPLRGGERFNLDPFLLSPMDELAKEAFMPVMGMRRQLAWKPRPIDQGAEGPFIERWLDWFASASNGSLALPSSMPEPEGQNGGFRR